MKIKCTGNESVEDEEIEREEIKKLISLLYV